MSSKSLSASIIIPNYNGRKLLEKFLPKVVMAAKGNEIIIVDDASLDDSVMFIKTNFPQIKIVSLSENQRFAGACNAGVTQASGEIVVLLNSDVEPAENFLDPLLAPFEDEKVFAVGCAEINSIEDKQKIYGRAGGAFKRGLLVHWRCEDQDKSSTLWVSGGSGAFRRTIWNELGGMDTLFKPAYEEDRDLCYRALKRGYKVLFAVDSKVFHNHETTNKAALGINKMKVASFKNHLILVWKNITEPRLFVQHLLWLPYHLLFSSIRSNGYFLLGFIEAIKSLPQIIKKRHIESRESKVGDVQVLASFKE